MRMVRRMTFLNGGSIGPEEPFTLWTTNGVIARNTYRYVYGYHSNEMAIASTFGTNVDNYIGSKAKDEGVGIEYNVAKIPITLPSYNYNIKRINVVINLRCGASKALAINYAFCKQEDDQTFKVPSGTHSSPSPSISDQELYRGTISDPSRSYWSAYDMTFSGIFSSPIKQSTNPIIYLYIWTEVNNVRVDHMYSIAGTINPP